MIRILALVANLVLCYALTSCKTKTTQETDSSNHLKHENSAYLLQHAQNPVDWYPWSDAAMQKAKEEKKLIIVSIGYSSCHWCHVMEKESFSDTTVSRFMNSHFVSIKVDREERPDVDNMYMSDCQRSNGGACGWPLNAITNSEGKTIWVTTYLSKDEWLKALQSIQAAYQEDPNEIEKMTRNFGQSNDEFSIAKEANLKFETSKISEMTKAIKNELDFVNGGKKTDIKFPLPSLLRSCYEVGFRQKDNSLLSFTETTLDKLLAGGIHDQLEGGFSRYSTDPLWKVPHFEKMLYDNAQLASMYSLAYQKTKKPSYLYTLQKLLKFTEQNLRSPESGFYSSIDADSDHQEGKYYAWTMDEIKNAITSEQDQNLLIDYYSITSNGNWEHNKNVLIQSADKTALTKKYKLPLDSIQSKIEALNLKLIAAKSNRTKPHLDKKIICSWSSMMTKSYADAFAATGNTAYKDIAISSGDFLINYMLHDSTKLYRSFSNGKHGSMGFLDDYAFCIDAFIRLYEISFDEKWLYLAKNLSEFAIANFSVENNPYFYYSSTSDNKVNTRKIEMDDQVTPSSNSVMCDNLHRLGLYFNIASYVARSQEMVYHVIAEKAESDPFFYSNWLRIYHEFATPMYEVAIVGENVTALQNEILSHYIPHMILLGGKNEGTLELLKEKLQEGDTYIYVCKNKVCKLPVNNVQKAIPLIQ